MKVKLNNNIYYSIVDKFLFNKSYDKNKELNNLLCLKHGESGDKDIFYSKLKNSLLNELNKTTHIADNFCIIKYQKNISETNFVKVLSVYDGKEIISKYLNLL